MCVCIIVRLTEQNVKKNLIICCFNRQFVITQKTCHQCFHNCTKCIFSKLFSYIIHKTELKISLNIYQARGGYIVPVESVKKMNW